MGHDYNLRSRTKRVAKERESQAQEMIKYIKENNNKAIYIRCNNLKYDVPTLKSIYLEVTNIDNSSSNYLSGYYHERNRSFNNPDVIYYYKRSADQGNIDAAYNTARLYEKITDKTFSSYWNRKKDIAHYKDAIKYYTISADGGHITSQGKLANLYLPNLVMDIGCKYLHMYSKSLDNEEIDGRLAMIYGNLRSNSIYSSKFGVKILNHTIKLMDEIEDLKAQVEHYKYKPPSLCKSCGDQLDEGGDGYEVAKGHFADLADK